MGATVGAGVSLRDADATDRAGGSEVALGGTGVGATGDATGVGTAGEDAIVDAAVGFTGVSMAAVAAAATLGGVAAATLGGVAAATAGVGDDRALTVAEVPTEGGRAGGSGRQAAKLRAATRTRAR